MCTVHCQRTAFQHKHVVNLSHILANATFMPSAGFSWQNLDSNKWWKFCVRKYRQYQDLWDQNIVDVSRSHWTKTHQRLIGRYQKNHAPYHHDCEPWNKHHKIVQYNSKHMQLKNHKCIESIDFHVYREKTQGQTHKVSSVMLSHPSPCTTSFKTSCCCNHIQTYNHPKNSLPHQASCGRIFHHVGRPRKKQGGKNLSIQTK